MECGEVAELLPDYSVGLAQGSRREAVEGHLARCPACAAEYRALLNVIALVNSVPRPEPPPGLWHGVRSRILAGETPRRASILQWLCRDLSAWQSAALLAAGAAAVALWVHIQLPRDPGWVSPPAAQAAYIRAHLELAGSDPLVGSAAVEPVIVLTGRRGGR